MLQWGTVSTNDCYNRLVGSITKVWQPFTTNMHTREGVRHQWCVVKVVARFLSNHWISHPYKTQYQCSMLQWGTVFTNDCYNRLVGSITKVWQPFTTNMHTRKVSDINDVLSKLWLDFCQILDFSPLQDSILVWHVAMRHCIHQWLLQ